MQKNKLNRYNDGYVNVYSAKENKNDFGASENIRSLDDLNFIIKLAYEERSKRTSDLEFAESSGHVLNLKICTPLLESLQNDYSIVLEYTLYSIINIDFDKQNRQMYIYLEEVRSLA